MSVQDFRTRYAVFSMVPTCKWRGVGSDGGEAVTPEDEGVVEKRLSGTSVSRFLRACSSEMKDVPTRSVITVSLDEAGFEKIA